MCGSFTLASVLMLIRPGPAPIIPEAIRSEHDAIMSRIIRSLGILLGMTSVQHVEDLIGMRLIDRLGLELIMIAATTTIVRRRTFEADLDEFKTKRLALGLHFFPPIGGILRAEPAEVTLIALVETFLDRLDDLITMPRDELVEGRDLVRELSARPVADEDGNLRAVLEITG